MCKLTRREIASVCVSKSCDEVLAYVEKRVPSSRPGEKRPRFSLYLSAQLMFGLSRILEKQSAFLLFDACNVYIRVRMIPVHDINLLEPPREDLVTQPEITEDISMVIDTSLDQFLEIQPPEGNLKEQFLGISSSSDHSSSASRRSRSLKRSSDADSALTVADIEQITLVEPPPAIVDTPLSPIPIPRELDLPPMNGQELDMLLETVPEARLSIEDLLPTSTPMHKEPEGQRRATLASPLLEEPREKTPSKRTTTIDTVRTRAVPPSPGVTQQILTSPLAKRQRTRASMQLELTPLIPSPARQRQRKRLVFADKETQISKRDLKQSFLTSSDTTRRLELNNPRAEGPEVLFNRPSRKGHPPEVLTGLWAKTAKFRSQIPEDQLPALESPSELSSEEERDIGREASVMREQLLQQEQSLMDLDLVQLDTSVTIGDAQLQKSLKVPEPEFRAPSPIPLVTPTEVRRRRSRKRSLEESVERVRRSGTASDLHGSRIGTPSMEQLRDASTSRLAGSLNLDESLILEDSRKSKADKSSTKKPRLSKREVDEAFAESVAASHTPTASTILYNLPEESFIGNQSLLDIVPTDLLEQQDLFLDKITETIHSQDSQRTTFSTVCPPQDTDKKTAAQNFMALLNLLKMRKVNAEQRRSFGEIYIYLQE